MQTDIIELETKIAFLEKHLQELSDTVYQQQKVIDDLSKRQSQLQEKFVSIDCDDTNSSAIEKPPHY